MAGFDNVAISPAFGYGSGGASVFNTDLYPLSDRREQRNQNWADEQRKFNLAYPINDISKIIALRNFFRLRKGKARGFLIEDPLDNSSLPSNSAGGTPTRNDQLLGVGNGVITDFQLKTNLADGVTTFDHYVYKPNSGTVLVAVGGTLKTLGSDYTLNTLGMVHFLVAPASGNVTAGFRYKEPVRFDSDEFSITYDEYNAFQVASLPLISFIPES